MSYARIALAGVGGFAAYFILGGLLFVLFPSMRTEFQKYPAVYRSKEAMTGLLPAGMAAMFVAILALAALYALVYRGGSEPCRGRAIRRSHRALLGRSVRGAARPREPEYRVGSHPSNGGCLFRGVDRDRHGDRPHHRPVLPN